MLALYVFSFVAALRILYVVFHRLVHSPLAGLPGPKVSAITGLWLMYKEFTRRRRPWIHSLHMKYGPVVRIAPDEVSFAAWEAVKEIYASGGSGYDKTSLYRLFDNFGTSTQCMFSVTEKGPHADVKKQFADRYSKSYIMRPDVVFGVKESAEEFVARCAQYPGMSVDIYPLLRCYALDTVTRHLFYPFGTKSLTEPSDLAKMEELSYYDNLKSSYFQYYFPAISRLIQGLFGERSNALEGLVSSYILNVVRNKDVVPDTVLHKLQMHKDTLDERAIASECMDHTVAGIDTGDGLCFLLYNLSLPSSASIQEKLRQECAERAGDSIEDLPYLDAVVKEGLRCFTPVTMSLPRLAPPGGGVIDGVFVPEGTIVSCQAYTLHRFDTRAFPEPETFAPERWLSLEGAIDRNQLFFAFAAGGRGCIGKHMAILEMKMLLREVYSTYHTRVAPDMKASMELYDRLLSSRPKDQMCLITFEDVVNSA